jgi:hypothetical protein
LGVLIQDPYSVAAVVKGRSEAGEEVGFFALTFSKVEHGIPILSNVLEEVEYFAFLGVSCSNQPSACVVEEGL